MFEGIEIYEKTELVEKKIGEETVLKAKGKVLKRSAIAYSLLFLTRRLALVLIVTVFKDQLFV